MRVTSKLSTRKGEKINPDQLEEKLENLRENTERTGRKHTVAISLQNNRQRSSDSVSHKYKVFCQLKEKKD